MQLTADQKLEVLLAVFADRRREVELWRRRAWQTALSTVGMYVLVAMFGVRVGGVPVLLLLIALGIVATLYLLTVEKHGGAAVRRLVEVEDALGLFAEGVYVEGLSLQPIQGKQTVKLETGTGLHIVAVWVGVVLVFFAMGGI